ncbi:hypothetical protein [Mucilaginibacter sp. R-33]|uniref:hypothetical protein n=1 Tax=Mucilaginibacter sp. R-33 TaxID=3416711 RepID=UPI003CEC57E7
MKTTDDLTGTLVLVHPDLTGDPAKRQGQIGIVTGADLSNDDIFVSFGKGEQALYSTDALLVFKPAAEIYGLLMNDARNAGKEDFKALFQVNLMQQHNTSGLVRKAMDIVKDNKVVREFSMDTLEHQLKISQNRGYEY